MQETEINKGDSITFIKLILELNPMQSKSVEEAFHSIHNEHDSQGDSGQE